MNVWDDYHPTPVWTSENEIEEKEFSSASDEDDFVILTIDPCDLPSEP